MDLETGTGKVLPVYIEEEMQKSYIDYAMSVIVQRALPDVRDGLPQNFICNAGSRYGIQQAL